MKSLPLTIGLLAALLMTTSARADRLRNVAVGDLVPPFTVSSIDGDELSSEASRGKVLVMLYVSAEQASSKRATRIMGALSRELRGEAVTFMLLTADATRVGFFRKQRDALGVHLPLGLDVGRTVYGAMGLIVLPTTMVVDRDGRLAHVLSSVKSDYEHLLRSYVRHSLGQLDDAELAEALESRGFRRNKPDDRIARRRAAARLLRERGLLADAGTELAAALEIDPNHAETLLDLASLRIAEERFDEARPIVDRVMKADPGQRRGVLLSGVLAYHRGDLEQAAKTLETALLLNPDPIWTHYYLGLTRERQGDAAAALVHYKQSLKRLLSERPM